ncbi:RNA polymerase sigma-70 factor [Pelobium manganitolerans]|nr:RNA polymerase sigma-70 factor [Pelobium manganitolerans]
MAVFDKKENACFESLFKSYYAKLIFFANKYVNDFEVAEELVSEVYANIWEKKDYHRISSLKPSFLYTSVKNASISWLRHQKIKSEYVEYLQRHHMVEPVLDEDALEEKDLEQFVNKAISQLPPRCQAVFKASRFDKRMNKEIAAELNISVKTVERQISIAISRLRLQLSNILSWLILVLPFFKA